MGLLNKRKQEDQYVVDDTSDTLVIFENDNKTADIVRVTALVDGAVIAAGKYKVPLLDCEVTTGREGRIFFYRAPAQSVIETERLAALEYNTVINQVTAYKPPIPPSSMDWTKGLLFGLLFVALIAMAF